MINNNIELNNIIKKEGAKNVLKNTWVARVLYLLAIFSILLYCNIHYHYNKLQLKVKEYEQIEREKQDYLDLISNTAHLIKKHEGKPLLTAKNGELGFYSIICHAKYTKTGVTNIVVSDALQCLREDIEYFFNFLAKDGIIIYHNNEFKAIVSLIYNVGYRNFKYRVFDAQNPSKNKYTELYKQIILPLDKRDTEKIKEAWQSFNTSKGKVLHGLTKRRKEEVELFLKNI